MNYSIFRKNDQKNQDFYVDLCRARCLLLDMGFEPIPIEGKIPNIRGWTTGEITQERIVYETLKHSTHLSTGLRTGRLVGIDIDLIDEAHAAVVSGIVDEVLGRTQFRRRGSKGAMLVYRKIGEPIGKIMIKEPPPVDENGQRLRDADGSLVSGKTLVELFGQGGQFVAYGIHPGTGQPYRWLEEGFEPALVPFDDLPGVTTEGLIALKERLISELTALGYKVATDQARTYDSPLRVGRIEDAVDVTEKFLSLIPGRAQRTHRGWINFECPECRHTDGRSGLVVLPDGGFKYHCFHAGCEFNRATGWSPGGGVGERVLRLYDAMGGDPQDLRKRRVPILRKVTIAELMAEMMKD
jgi:hypothetical protein